MIDLTAYLAGPFLSMHLGALGAEVIKIERPGIGDPTRISAPFAGPRGVGFEGRRPEAMPKETKNYISHVENLYQNYSKA